MAADLGEDCRDVWRKGVWPRDEHTSHATEVDSRKEELEVNVEDPALASMRARVGDNASVLAEPVDRCAGVIHARERLGELSLDDLERGDGSKYGPCAATFLGDLELGVS